MLNENYSVLNNIYREANIIKSTIFNYIIKKPIVKLGNNTKSYILCYDPIHNLISELMMGSGSTDTHKRNCISDKIK